MAEIKHKTIIFKRMCRVINIKYKDVNFSKKDWYLEHSWSEKKCNNFQAWLEDYLYKSSAARKELMNVPIKNKKVIKDVVDWFILNYGWRIK